MAKVNKLFSYAFGLLGGLGAAAFSSDAKAQTAAEDTTYKMVGFDKQLADTLLPYAFMRTRGDDLIYERIVYMGDSPHIYQTDEQWKAKTTLFTMRVNDLKQVAIWAEDRDSSRLITENEIVQVIEDVADTGAGVVKRKTSTFVPGTGYTNLSFEMPLTKGTVFYDMNDYPNTVPSIKAVNKGLPPIATRALDIFLMDDAQQKAATVAEKSKKRKRAEKTQLAPQNTMNNIVKTEAPLKTEQSARLANDFIQEIKNISLASDPQFSVTDSLYQSRGHDLSPRAFIDVVLSKHEKVSVNANDEDTDFLVKEKETTLFNYFYEGKSKTAKVSVLKLEADKYDVVLSYADNAALLKVKPDDDIDAVWKDVDIGDLKESQNLLDNFHKPSFVSKIRAIIK